MKNVIQRMARSGSRLRSCALILFVLIVVDSLAACTQGVETLQAKAAIEHAWNKRSVGLVSGNVQFIGDGAFTTSNVDQAAMSMQRSGNSEG